MKKISIILASLIFVFCLVSCNKNLDTLDKKTEAKLLADWQNEFGHELGSINAYYGTYGDCVVFLVEGDTLALKSIEVAGTVFSYNVGFEIYVYKDHHFYLLQDAYEKNYLTKDDIVKIGEYHQEYSKKIMWAL